MNDNNSSSNDALTGQILKESFAKLENEADFTISPDVEKRLFESLSLVSPYSNTADPTNAASASKYNKSASDRRMVRSFSYPFISSLWKVVIPVAALVIVIGGSNAYLNNRNAESIEAVIEGQLTVSATKEANNQLSGKKVSSLTTEDQYSMLVTASDDWAAEENSAYTSGDEEEELVLSDGEAINNYNSDINEDEI
jgi:hypothetical protein